MNESIGKAEKDIDFVAIGGGTGLATLLTGLKHFVDAKTTTYPRINELSAIVAVSDDGGSSGRLRDELQMPPPGDIRNCMVAMSEDSRLLSKLFRYRFSGQGDLGGHSFGNLFLAALTEITGDFAEAVRLSSEILASKGHIYPATNADVRISARLTDGTIVRGETNISRSGPMIDRLFLDPEDCEPLELAEKAIKNADMISVGPGSLYTSLLPPLLVPGLAASVSASNALKVFISNLMTQPGETDGLSARGHLEALTKHVPEMKFDVVVINSQPISDLQKGLYESEGSEQIGLRGCQSGENLKGARIVYGELLAEGEKVRHDPAKLADLVLSASKG
jgi:uncharacterized cofD-like protein